MKVLLFVASSLFLLITTQSTDGTRGLIRGERNHRPYVKVVRRDFSIDGDTLHYVLFMSTDNNPSLTHHLECTLKRIA